MQRRLSIRYVGLVCSTILLSLSALSLTAAEARPLEGLELTDAIRELQSRGVTIVYTSQLVKPGMKVETEPTATDPEAILAEILRAHGLAARERSSGVFVVVRGAPDSMTLSISGRVRSGATGEPVQGALVNINEGEVEVRTTRDGRFSVTNLPPGNYTIEAKAYGFLGHVVPKVDVSQDADVGTIELITAPIVRDAVVVQPSRLHLLETEPTAPMSLSRDEIDRLPHLGGDLFRALSLMPGTAANDLTSQISVHGGRRDEILVVFDGQELYDAYHLKDYDNALSIISNDTLREAKLTTGAYPASHGDRMSGVLDLTSASPRQPMTTRASISLLTMSLMNSGTLPNGRGGWLITARQSSVVLPSKFTGSERPTFWDAFGKFEYDLNGRNTLRFQALVAGDALRDVEQEEELKKDFNTEYANRYAWLIHQSIVGSLTFLQTTASWSETNRERRGLEIDDDLEFEIVDERYLEVLGLSQTWNVQLSASNILQIGAEGRQYQARYDYKKKVERVLSTDEVDYVDDPEGEHLGLWVTDRLTPIERLTLEVGLRFDRHTLTEDTLTSPRVNAAWRLGVGSVLRASWGLFHQTQRPYELQVEDGETRFFPAERSEHWVLGTERLFTDPNSRISAFRIEAFSRDIENPRQRFENLLEPINTFPEIEPDRVLIEPDQSRAYGVEILLRGNAGLKTDWGLTYSWAKSEDRFDNAWHRRKLDQRHTVVLNLNRALGKHWNLNAAWRYHSGWPTTPFTFVDVEDPEDENETVPTFEFGQYNSADLAEYHRLDLRVSREWNLRLGRLIFFLDVQNAYGRNNLAGFDITTDEETGELMIAVETWPGVLPSIGITWEF